MADTDIVLRAPASAPNIILSSAAGTSPGLWVMTAGGSKRATGIWVNTAGGAKQLTSLPVLTAGGRKDMVFE